LSEHPETEIIDHLLNEIHAKIKIFSIVFRPRDKNLKTLAELGITAGQRLEFIQELSSKNYVSGPNRDTFDQSLPDYYEFGLLIAGKEIYIKLSPGLPNKPVDCMSFHIAERKLKYHLTH
jgi:hypothetical protein